VINVVTLSLNLVTLSLNPVTLSLNLVTLSLNVVMLATTRHSFITAVSVKLPEILFNYI
jgi:hypothetical protein